MSYFCSRKTIRDLGSLAQLVQSIALTRRGSLVRVQQFPRNIKINPLEISGFLFTGKLGKAAVVPNIIADKHG